MYTLVLDMIDSLEITKGAFINDVTQIWTILTLPPLSCTYALNFCPVATKCLTPFPSLCDVIYE